MTVYRRNNFRGDHINRFGATVGLPLFESMKSDAQGPSEAQRARFEHAPKAMELGTDTRKLSHMMLVADEMRLGEMQRLVLEAFCQIGPATNEEIARHLKLPINRVVGRTFELREFGLVVGAGKKQCGITGNVVRAWDVKRPVDRDQANL